MKRTILFVLMSIAIPLYAVNTTDTRLLTDPAVSAKQIAFAYANDIWTANPDGSGVSRLTSHPGVESGPHFSPDGKWIAFTGNYDGNTDVFIVPAAGGVPRRLDTHPLQEEALACTPDGSAIGVSAPREVYTRRY